MVMMADLRPVGCNFTKSFLLPPATKLGQDYVFTRVCDSVHRVGSPGPHPGGRLRGLAGWRDLQSHTRRWGCIPACNEADTPSRWLLLRAVRILLECILVWFVHLWRYLPGNIQTNLFPIFDPLTPSSAHNHYFLPFYKWMLYLIWNVWNLSTVSYQRHCCDWRLLKSHSREISCRNTCSIFIRSVLFHPPQGVLIVTLYFDTPRRVMRYIIIFQSPLPILVQRSIQTELRLLWHLKMGSRPITKRRRWRRRHILSVG